MYTACEIVGNELEIDFGVDIVSLSTIEIYVNKGWTVSGVASSASTDKFMIDADWSSVDIVVDSSVDAVKTFTPSAAMTGVISSPALTMSNNNAGEYADYGFTFKSNAAFAASDKIEIYFPNSFDPFVGNASEWFDNESGTYYLKCTSTALGLSWCKVDKWKVTVMGSSPVDASTEIDITIVHVSNPIAGASVQKLIVSLINSDGVCTATATDFANGGITTVDAPANNIDIASVTSSSHDLFATSNYTFKYFLGQTSTVANESLWVLFPMQYDLNLNSG